MSLAPISQENDENTVVPFERPHRPQLKLMSGGNDGGGGNYKIWLFDHPDQSIVVVRPRGSKSWMTKELRIVHKGKTVVQLCEDTVEELYFWVHAQEFCNAFELIEIIRSGP